MLAPVLFLCWLPISRRLFGIKVPWRSDEGRGRAGEGWVLGVRAAHCCPYAILLVLAFWSFTKTEHRDILKCIRRSEADARTELHGGVLAG